MKEASLEDEWSVLMQASRAGDATAYRKFARSVTPFVRAVARRHDAELGRRVVDTEDIVQEVLLAIHLKGHTFDSRRPLKPWISAITRNKVIDAHRRRGREAHVPIDSVIETLEAGEVGYQTLHGLQRMLDGLKETQRAVVMAVSVEGASARQAGESLGMTEGAVRASLHRALKALAAGL